jgi:hypothetical protein
MSLLKDIGVLVDELILVPDNVPFYYGEAPPMPDEAILISRYTGPVVSQDRTHSRPGLTYERPSIQIIYRSKSAERAQDQVDIIYRNLPNTGHRIINGVRYLNISPVSTVVDLGRDENARALCAASFSVLREM